ncbi:hypothetical protein DPMN_084803 [Dreissena polymorpha]|uniref:Uncharacterized protein n=1 Tax=Dreissena polymorpha TaxID=45954 RepID=A0A9D3YDT9_DREPO|nr:hypothetical protein DPMN_084803 [Dreissena polymorpha]
MFPVRAQADDSIRNNWQGETSGYPETEPSSRTGIKLAVAEARGEELEAINQHTVTDHHCGPTAIRMFMEVKGRNILRRRNPC